MTKRERSLLETFYQQLSGGDTKRFQLLKEISREPEITDNQLSKLLYGEERIQPKFTQLKARVTRDILGVLIVSQGKDKYTSRYFQKRFDIKQSILDAELLLSKGLYAEGIGILKRALRQAQKIELTDEALTIVSILLNTEGIRGGNKVYERYLRQREGLATLQAAKQRAADLFNKITIPSLYSSSDQVTALDATRTHLSELRSVHDTIVSREIQGHLLRAEVYLAYQTGDFIKGKQHGIDYLHLVESDVIHNSKGNLTGANMQLSMLSVSLGEFEESIAWCDAALQSVRPGTANELRVLDVKFVALLNLMLLENAGDILHKVKRNRSLQTSDYLKGVWQYREAALLFLNKDFEEALHMLQKQSPLAIDREGWRLGLHLLEVMCIVELELYDRLDYRITSFYRLLNELKFDKDSRIWKAYAISKALSSSDLNFQEVNEKFGTELEFLSSRERWDPLGYEIVPFDKWFLEKLEE